MSLIRQRSKNLLIAGCIGFILALTLLLVIYITFIRGNLTVMEFLLKDSQLEVSTHKEVPEPLIEKTSVYVLTQNVQKNEVITREMLRSIQVISDIVPQNACLDIENMMNHKALIDIAMNVIVTDDFIIPMDWYEVDNDSIEISQIHIPEVINIGDKVNMRIHFPTGQDYLVLENKKVTHIDEELLTFFISLEEEEILSYSSAREDVLLYPGTELYITKIVNEYEPMPKNESQVDLTASETNMMGGASMMDGTSHLKYVQYPLNPNTQQLSKYYASEFILAHRKVLDQSLITFFEQEKYRYAYEIDDELAAQSFTSEEDALISDEEKNDVNGNDSDESTLQETQKEELDDTQENASDTDTDSNADTDSDSKSDANLDSDETIDSDSESDTNTDSNEDGNIEGEYDF